MSKMRFTEFVFIFVSLCLCISDASICEPHSTFKVDCNSCKCSTNGREYSCSDNVCPPMFDNNDRYDVKQTRDGYRILVPKTDVFNVNSVLTKKLRFPRIPNGYPYINDEIPPSKEVTDNKFEDIDDINEETEGMDEHLDNAVDSSDDMITIRRQKQHPE